MPGKNLMSSPSTPIDAQETAQIDPREFRSALGSFATGVTVVTTCGADGAPVGLTVNSFNSVSLQPPMVLWSLGRQASSLAAFRATQHWVVHVLAADQEDLSKRFSSRAADRFADLPSDRGVGGVPLLRECAARFQCRTAFEYDGGDHVIFVGEVLSFERSQKAPLLFHDGRYALAMRKDLPAEAVSAAPSGAFSREFMGYLVGRAYFRLRRALRAELRSLGIGNDEYYVLASLALNQQMRVDELQRVIGDLLTATLDEALASLASRQYIRRNACGATGETCSLAPAGREYALRMIAAAKSFESQLIEQVGAEESFALKALLRRLTTIDLRPGADPAPDHQQENP
jgi:3-hydroxy-9,10-secoandrosta-1,3,5(10)-triene-9,17-dione monooxygenase reductase component